MNKETDDDIPGQISIAEWLKDKPRNEKCYLHYKPDGRVYGTFPTNTEWRAANLWVYVADRDEIIEVPGRVKDCTYIIPKGFVGPHERTQIRAWQYAY